MLRLLGVHVHHIARVVGYGCEQLEKRAKYVKQRLYSKPPHALAPSLLASLSIVPDSHKSIQSNFTTEARFIIRRLHISLASSYVKVFVLNVILN